jgi:3-oxoadipate enol-lactonase
MPLHHTLDGPHGAPVLVLSGSLGTTVDMWSPQLDALSRGWRVLRVDHPGHGRSMAPRPLYGPKVGWGGSPLPDGPVTVESIARSILDLLDGLGFQQVSVCGLSLGGAVGQWLAAHASPRVERLVLCSTAASFVPTRGVYLQRAAVVRERGMAAVAESVLARWFTPAFFARQPAEVARYRQMLEDISPEGYAACCEAVAGFDGRGDLEQKIRAPTLVLAGADDPATPVKEARLLSEKIPGARLQVIAEAAHLVNVEQPGAVGDAIQRHLKGE